MTIIKCPETMSAKERVRRTFAHEKTDRVTIGYEANPAVHLRVAQALGIPDGDDEKVCRALGVDYRGIGAPYIGKQLHKVPENRRVNQMEGCIMRWVPNKSGGYWDFCDFPLKDAEDEEFDAFPVPNPDDFDYDAAYEQARALTDTAVFVGDAGTPDVINSNGRIMGMEDVLCHLLTGNEAAMRFMRRRADFQYEVLRSTLERCKGLIDFMWLGEDLGTQHTQMISTSLYRKALKPVHARFASLAKEYGLPVIMHSCGSSSWAFEDYIEIGINGVDTLQPEAHNMAPEYLKKTFGSRLCYRGCISTAGELAYGTPEQVRECVRRTLSIMMEGGGYHFAPTHEIQDNTPEENVIAMYQAAHDFGRY